VRRRGQAVEAAVELARASAELHAVSPTRIAGLLGKLEGAGQDELVGAAELHQAVLIGRTVAATANRLPWHPTCLRQALAVQRMLRRRGIPSQLHLGITSANDAAAHAWVTVDGQPVVGGRGLERFVPLAAFS
jgi:hypothetical protein